MCRLTAMILPLDIQVNRTSYFILVLWMKDMGLKGQTSYILPYTLAGKRLATFTETTREPFCRVEKCLSAEEK